jgi:hypothetical protein
MSEKIVRGPIPDQKQAAFDAMMERHMNPVPAEEFDPATFDPMKLNGHPHAEVGGRERVQPPKRLPTMGMKPKKIREGQMVGMFESKQDLYLLIAYAFDRITDLEEEINTLKNGKQTP